MEIHPTALPGVFRIASQRRGDHRGYLVRTWCEETFRGAGLNTRWMQSSVTSSPITGTLRGMHFQTSPFGEIKLIRCLTGTVWDCLIDARPDSPAYGKWQAFELSEENGDSLYVPEGIAHGFLTLTPDVRMHYSMSTIYSAAHASGFRWDDPAFGIQWPGTPALISEKDQTWPLLADR